MKKLFLILALAASVQVASAQQVKSVAAAKSALESAQAATENPKKADKTATWLKYGQALVDAYNAPQGNAWVGASKQELQLVLGNEKPKSSETVTLQGQPWTKEVYAGRNYYYNANGQLGIIEVTQPIDKKALDKAVEAYAKAAKLDEKGKKTKDIVTALEGIVSKYTDEAYNAYTLGDFAKASDYFEKTAAAAATAPLSKLDTNSIYNAAFTAWQVGNNERAEKFFKDCISYGYYADGGEVYAKLADIADKYAAADTLNAPAFKEMQKNYLEEAFTKFPQSQSILVGLINYYVTSGENTGRLFELLDEAKKNEPNNASLYYVEGNIHDKLGQTEEAVASYRQCSEIDPNYAYGYIGEGILFYNKAVKIQEDAQNEMDDNKYMALVADFEKTLKACIPPFEKAYELCSDSQTKVSIAEYLKNACFRFRTDEEDTSFKEKFEKYKAVVDAGAKTE